MRLDEFLFEDRQGNSYLIKNHLAYMPIDQWIESETGQDPNSTDLDEEQPDDQETWVNDPRFQKVPDQEFKDYLARQKADQTHRVSKSSGDKRQAAMQQVKQNWSDMPPARDKKARNKDYYTQPYIHGSSIKFMQGSHEIDVESVKRIIKMRPKNLLKQNEKMEHSGGGDIYFNVGLPALRGIAVNEQTNEIIYVNTCPGAGACQKFCYAKKGNYIMFKASWEKAAKTLNFLINDPTGFENMLSAEIQKQEAKWSEQGFQINVRWHDAGDFFSDQYLTLAFNIAKKFPNINFYCYTKIANVMLSKKPENFISNWSEGASGDQNIIIKKFEAKFGKLKRSIVVPASMFDKYTEFKTYPDPAKPKKKIKELAWNSEGALDSFKRDLVLNYNVPKESIITYNQLVNTPRGNQPKWNIIVRPGDGDSGANRNDVDGVFLLFH